MDCDWAARTIKKLEAPLRRKYRAATDEPSEDEPLTADTAVSATCFYVLEVFGHGSLLIVDERRLLHFDMVPNEIETVLNS